MNSNTIRSEIDTSCQNATIAIDMEMTSQGWGGVGLSDAAVSPANDLLVKRNSALLEDCIVRLMAWREHKLETVFGTPSIVESTTSRSTRQKGRTLPGPAHSELLDFVSTIASKYNDVLYHNFEHASHVTASTYALLSIIRTASCSSSTSNSMFGMAADPMVDMAMIFSALVHDVDHQGVGNKQLIQEDNPSAMLYNDQSVAENNSLAIAFSLLRKDKFSNLRACMFGAPSQVKSFDDASVNGKEERVLQENEWQFRHIVIDVILSTDISSPERLEIGRSKWRHAFENSPQNVHHITNIEHKSLFTNKSCEAQSKKQKLTSTLSKTSERITNEEMTLGIERALTNDGSIVEYNPGGPAGLYSSYDRLCASTVLEQIIQAADVAHTMQSWDIFTKWNRKLYFEFKNANGMGRGPDCTSNWFQGQIGFFDIYVLPLTQRLEQCAIFGSAGSLFHANAMKNKIRWEKEGAALCKEMHEYKVKRQIAGEATGELSRNNSNPRAESYIHVN